MRALNAMTLATAIALAPTIAVAIGVLVDDAIVDVENIYRRLRQNRAEGSPVHPLLIVYRASSEVRKPILVGTLLVVTDKDRRQISGADLRMMSELAPHVRRAVMIGDMFEALFGELDRRGRLRGGDVEQAIQFIWMVLHGIVSLRSARPDVEWKQWIVDYSLDTALRGLLNGDDGETGEGSQS